MLGCSLTTSDWTELNARLCVAMRLECLVSRWSAGSMHSHTYARMRIHREILYVVDACMRNQLYTIGSVS